MTMLEEHQAEAKANPTRIDQCPACNHVRGNKMDARMVYTCAGCGAIFHRSGTLYLGDSYTYVLPVWHQGESSPEEECYYDFTTLGSKGIERRHGWFNVRTKKITQTG